MDAQENIAARGGTVADIGTTPVMQRIAAANRPARGRKIVTAEDAMKRLVTPSAAAAIGSESLFSRRATGGFLSLIAGCKSRGVDQDISHQSVLRVLE